MESSKVFVRVRKQNQNIPDEVYLGTRKAIGATLGKGGVVTTGLSKDEEKKYLPHILGMESTSVDWNKTINNYFASLVIRVPYGEEVPLDLSKDKDGEYNNPLDYIKYKFALAHPQVAMSKEECKGTKIFYIYNPSEAVNKQFAKLGIKKDAYKELIKISDKPEKMDSVMHVLGLSTKGKADKEKELELEKFLERDPILFTETVKDKDLEMKSFIEECISYKVLDKIGSSIIDGDEPIGEDMREAVIFLNNKSNSGVLVKLKARLTQSKKAK